MRTTGLGALIGAALMLLAMLVIGQRNEAAAQYGVGQKPAGQYGGASAASNGLITLASTTAENRQQLTIIDPQTKVMCVYQIEPATGVVALKSVRNFRWDLQMSEFNAVSPLPREIRAMLESH